MIYAASFGPGLWWQWNRVDRFGWTPDRRARPQAHAVSLADWYRFCSKKVGHLQRRLALLVSLFFIPFLFLGSTVFNDYRELTSEVTRDSFRFLRLLRNP